MNEIEEGKRFLAECLQMIKRNIEHTKERIRLNNESLKAVNEYVEHLQMYWDLNKTKGANLRLNTFLTEKMALESETNRFLTSLRTLELSEKEFQLLNDFPSDPLEKILSFNLPTLTKPGPGDGEIN